MNEVELRKSLLNNSKKMCEYVENRLQKCSIPFDYKFNVGYIYGHSCDYIHIVYNKDKICKICVSHYDSAMSVYVCKGKVFKQVEDECTKLFLNNFNGYIMKEMESAIKDTMKNWDNIKIAIEQHLSELNEIKKFVV